MFKSIVPAIAIAAMLAVPGFAQAREDGPVTRAQVRAELVQLERAGYNPVSSEVDYPADIQAAEARVAAASFGGASEGSSAAGKGGRAVSAADAIDFNRP
ncbi:purine nucleoside phosphorylase [Caballeronia pedi]|uniref:Purine nucleoside phosphorylase n=1 Tax=Caballeronia pedi TaxID=1777141 RepID=A0A158BXG6_9BURK|nr:DUF4148 domain-containing protein [Caballeronia pedi]SAK74804.1 purine nucleoside phosphorylase [Caballeronia pedi]